jgi:hypothetical protein
VGKLVKKREQNGVAGHLTVLTPGSLRMGQELFCGSEKASVEALK